MLTGAPAFSSFGPSATRPGVAPSINVPIGEQPAANVVANFHSDRSILQGAAAACAFAAGGCASAAVKKAGRRHAAVRRKQAVVAVQARGGEVAAAVVAAAGPAALPKVDRKTTKDVRRELTSSEKYFRFGKSDMDKAMQTLKGDTGSELIEKLRENGQRLTIGDVTFVLAESLGFCWGVERTLSMAYQARRVFPEQSMWITNEIIHNAVINQKMTEMGMRVVPTAANGNKDFSVVQPDDVVLFPAFGASVDEMAYLKNRNVEIVDTTCPWVSKVWKSVERGNDKAHTSIIHGKAQHEETVATKSFAETYLVVKNMQEAEYVADYILNRGSAAEFLQKFKGCMSEGFDPDVDLERVAVANQTTMLKGETELVGRLFERTMIQKFGPQHVDDHFLAFNTICDATQERQDAMYKMFGAAYEAPTSVLYAELEGEQVGIQLKSEKALARRMAGKKQKEVETKAAATSHDVDLCLVVGGFNSSNTGHLIEIPQELGVRTYHVDCAQRIGGVSPDGAVNAIQHKPLATPPAEAMLDQGLEITDGFLPEGPVTIAVTAGASTPDSSIGQCLEKILAIRGLA